MPVLNNQNGQILILVFFPLHSSPARSETIEHILIKLATVINDDVTCKFNVWRGDVWGCARRGFMKKSYTPEARMDVVFTDDDGTGEGAVDFGGPRREFLTLLMEALQSRPLFAGDSKVLTNDAAGKGNMMLILL